MCPAISNYSLTIGISWNFLYITVILPTCWVIAPNIRFYHDWLYDDDGGNDNYDDDDDDDDVQGNIFIYGLSGSPKLNVILVTWKVVFQVYQERHIQVLLLLVFGHHRDVWLQYQNT